MKWGTRRTSVFDETTNCVSAFKLFYDNDTKLDLIRTRTFMIGVLAAPIANPYLEQIAVLTKHALESDSVIETEAGRIV